MINPGDQRPSSVPVPGDERRISAPIQKKASSSAPSAQTGIDSNSGRLRQAIGGAALAAFAINLMLARSAIGDARDGDASAIQIIQVWTPHIYYAILITGVAIALYIYSRANDNER